MSISVDIREMTEGGERLEREEAVKEKLSRSFTKPQKAHHQLQSQSRSKGMLIVRS